MRATWFLVPQLSPALFFENKQSSDNGSGLKESPTLPSIDAKDSPTLSVVGENESLMNSAKNDQTPSPVTAPMAFVERAYLAGAGLVNCKDAQRSFYYPDMKKLRSALQSYSEAQLESWECKDPKGEKLTSDMQLKQKGAEAIQQEATQHVQNQQYAHQQYAQQREQTYQQFRQITNQLLFRKSPMSPSQIQRIMNIIQSDSVPLPQDPEHGQHFSSVVPSSSVPLPHGQHFPEHIMSFMETPTEQSIPVGVEQHHIQSATRTSFRGSLPSRVSEGEKSL